MLEAAGIVVTEIRTPISAPDLAFVSERIPATPATKATKNEKKSGLEMKSVSSWSRRHEVVRARPDPLEHQRRETGKHDAGRESRRRGRRTSAGRGPSAAGRAPRTARRAGRTPGPTTMAPTIRIGWSSRMPTAPICMASTMNATKLIESSVFSLVRCSTSSQTTASEGRPGAAFSAATAASESEVSMCSTAIEPTRGISSSLRSPMITLASSRATSHRIRSPSGFVAARVQVDHVEDRRRAVQDLERLVRLRPPARRSSGGSFGVPLHPGAHLFRDLGLLERRRGR